MNEQTRLRWGSRENCLEKCIRCSRAVKRIIEDKAKEKDEKSTLMTIAIFGKLNMTAENHCQQIQGRFCRVINGSHDFGEWTWQW